MLGAALWVLTLCGCQSRLTFSIAIASLTSLTSAAAEAAEMSASQVYKLCLDEQPTCIASIRVAFNAAAAAQQAEAEPQFKFCLGAQTPTDEQLVSWFIETAQNAGYGLSYPVGQFEVYVLSRALPCR
jgi:hypothetical protein